MSTESAPALARAGVMEGRRVLDQRALSAMRAFQEKGVKVSCVKVNAFLVCKV